MARIKGSKVDIDQSAVLDFFQARARKVAELGPLRAVIYQDKHPDLAEIRDRAEKQLLLPKLALGEDERVLDVGCGTGRWAKDILPSCARYHGVDVSPGLIEVARDIHGAHRHAQFSVCPIDRISLGAIGEAEPFTRVLCAGVLIYLNDDQLGAAMRAISQCAAGHARVVLREPVGIDGRLTIKEHFSEDMEQTYNAIYRTEADLLEVAAASLDKFRLLQSDDVYSDAALNNRAETKQRYFIFDRVS
jgi:SAM-dependent methyltransferase